MTSSRLSNPIPDLIGAAPAFTIAHHRRARKKSLQRAMSSTDVHEQARTSPDLSGQRATRLVQGASHEATWRNSIMQAVHWSAPSTLSSMGGDKQRRVAQKRASFETAVSVVQAAVDDDEDGEVEEVDAAADDDEDDDEEEEGEEGMEMEVDGLELPLSSSPAGYVGVRKRMDRNGSSKPFQARYFRKHLGYFATAVEAAVARARHVADEMNELQSARGRSNAWECEEDAMLVRAIERLGPRWKLIARLFPDRTDAMCRCRWSRLRSMPASRIGGDGRRVAQKRASFETAASAVQAAVYDEEDDEVEEVEAAANDDEEDGEEEDGEEGMETEAERLKLHLSSRNTTGYTGVYIQHSKSNLSNPFRAEYRERTLGHFSTAIKAAAAYAKQRAAELQPTPASVQQEAAGRSDAGPASSVRSELSEQARELACMLRELGRAGSQAKEGSTAEREHDEIHRQQLFSKAKALVACYGQLSPEALAARLSEVKASIDQYKVAQAAMAVQSEAGPTVGAVRQAPCVRDEWQDLNDSESESDSEHEEETPALPGANEVEAP